MADIVDLATVLATLLAFSGRVAIDSVFGSDKVSGLNAGSWLIVGENSNAVLSSPVPSRELSDEKSFFAWSFALSFNLWSRARFDVCSSF